MHEAFASMLDTGEKGGGDLETTTEVVLGVFYALMFNWANLDSYPLRKRALSAARFLGDAVDSGAGRRGR